MMEVVTKTSHEGTTMEEQCAKMYIDLVDNHREQLVRHLSDDVILDWFGRIIGGKEMLLNFFKQETPMEHKLVSVKPAEPIKIQRRPSVRKQRKQLISDCEETFPSGYFKIMQEKSYILTDQKLPFYHTGKKFPKVPVNICKDLSPPHSSMPGISLNGRLQSLDPVSEEKCFVEACGSIEFTITKQSPTSTKNLKLIAETSKWERNFKLHLSCTVPRKEGYDSVRNLEIFQIIYSSASRCRKNLCEAFSQA